MSVTITGYVKAISTDGTQEKPVQGVAVSTEQDFCVTDAAGKFTLNVAPDDVFVKISTPRGWRSAGPWYYELAQCGPTEREEFVFRLAPDPQRDVDEFTFAQVTDLHIGFGTSDMLRADLAQVTLPWGGQLAFLLATGDLSTNGLPSELQEFSNIRAEQPCPVFCVPGNHDYTKEDPTGVNYGKILGPPCYSFDWGPVHFVAYDCISVPRREINLAWLERDLKALPTGQPVILFTHYPLDDSFYSLWREYNIVAGITGHWHSSRLYYDGHTTHFNGPSFTIGCIDFSPRGYRRFTWRQDRLTARTVYLTNEWSQRPAPVSVASHGGMQAARPSLERIWEHRLPGEVHLARPVVHEDCLLVTSKLENKPGEGYVTCLQADTGLPRWTVNVGDAVKNAVAVGSGLVFANTVTGEVVALDFLTGREVWRHELADRSARWLFSAPAYAQGRVYAGTAGCFACLDAGSGRLIWERRDLGTSDWISSYVNPVVTGTTLVVGFVWRKPGLCGLDANTGATKWLYGDQNNESAVSAPTICDGFGYIMKHDKVLRKFDPETGQMIWEVAGFTAWSPAAPTVSGNMVYAASAAGRIVALDATSGQITWEWQPKDETAPLTALAYARKGTAILASPLMVEGLLWVATTAGYLHALSPADGKLVTSHAHHAPILATPGYAAGTLYVADIAGRVCAYRIGK